MPLHAALPSPTILPHPYHDPRTPCAGFLGDNFKDRPLVQRRGINWLPLLAATPLLALFGGTLPATRPDAVEMAGIEQHAITSR